MIPPFLLMVVGTAFCPTIRTRFRETFFQEFLAGQKKVDDVFALCPGEFFEYVYLSLPRAAVDVLKVLL